MTALELVSALEARPMERLRFRVLREFSVLPLSRQGRKMTDGQCLLYAAHMVLNLGGEDEGERGESFDPMEFERKRRRPDEH